MYFTDHLHVEVRVEKDNGIGRGEVETDTAGARRQQEDERLRAASVEALHSRETLLAANLKINNVTSLIAQHRDDNALQNWSHMSFAEICKKLIDTHCSKFM